jgi:hypothetical protein
VLFRGVVAVVAVEEEEEVVVLLFVFSSGSFPACVSNVKNKQIKANKNELE